MAVGRYFATLCRELESSIYFLPSITTSAVIGTARSAADDSLARRFQRIMAVNVPDRAEAILPAMFAWLYGDD